MRTLLPSLSTLLTTMCCVGTCHAESQLTYEDLRAQVGTDSGSGQYGAITFIGGDVGDKDLDASGDYSDLGITVGIRGLSGRVKATPQVSGPSDNLALNVLGVQLLGGLSIYGGANDLFETLIGFDIGVSSEVGQTALNHRDGHYTGYRAEQGWYHTFSDFGDVQFGLIVGYEIIKDTFSLGSGDTLNAKARGFDLSVSSGYRF
jgi:hypothetical protein